MKKVLLVVVVLVVVGGGYWYMKKQYAAPAMQPASETPAQMAATPEAMSGAPAAGDAMEASTTKEFKVDGSEFAFTPSTLSVKKGDTVKVTFTNTGKYPHNFTISELNVVGKTVQAGQSDMVTFTADKAGSFKYTCSVPGHEEKGMVGTITVQ